MEIPVVENPRRRRRHRKLTAKQIAYGFGGGRRRSHRRRPRRNPALASLMANPRRRRHRRYAVANPRRRRYHNPGLISTAMIDVKSALYVGGGILAAKIAPGLLVKVWAGAPTTGFGRSAVELAGGFVAATVVRMVTKSNQAATLIMAGAMGYVLYDLAQQYVLPSIGLAGLGDDRPVRMSELQEIGVSGYRVQPTAMSGYSAESLMSV